MASLTSGCKVRLPLCDHQHVFRVHISAGADFIFIPERPPTDPWEEEMCHAIKKVSHSISHDPALIKAQHREIGKRTTIVIVAEGAHDSSLKPIKTDYVKEILSEKLGLDTRVTTLGHTQRGGRPCGYDRILVSNSCACICDPC